MGLEKKHKNNTTQMQWYVDLSKVVAEVMAGNRKNYLVCYVMSNLNEDTVTVSIWWSKGNCLSSINSQYWPLTCTYMDDSSPGCAMHVGTGQLEHVTTDFVLCAIIAEQQTL